MVHPRKISLAESLGSSRFFISKIFCIFHLDHLKGFGFGTVIDGAQGGSDTAKMFRRGISIGVNSS